MWGLLKIRIDVDSAEEMKNPRKYPILLSTSKNTVIHFVLPGEYIYIIV